MVPAASHRIPRVPWYLRTPLEDQSTFAYRAITVCGGPFQGPSASGWFCNIDVIPPGDPRPLYLPPRHGGRPSYDARFGGSPFGLPHLAQCLFFHALQNDSVRPL